MSYLSELGTYRLARVCGIWSRVACLGTCHPAPEYSVPVLRRGLLNSDCKCVFCSSYAMCSLRFSTRCVDAAIFLHFVLTLAHAEKNRAVCTMCTCCDVCTSIQKGAPQRSSLLRCFCSGLLWRSERALRVR